MSERAINVATKKRLINNEPFVYAHLIKFERPRKIKEASELINTDAARYGYLTDAAFNISFDDGTTDVLDNSNGSQIYYADKIFNIGAYTESIDPKATGMSLTLAAESLYNSITSSTIAMANSGSTITATNIEGSQGGYMNFMDEGFREGDKILITGGTNSGKTCVITKIKTNGTVLVVNKVLRPETSSDNTDDYTFDPDMTVNSTITDQSTGTAITLKIDTDELKGPLVEMNNQSSLKSYHNRTVFVYKVLLNPDDNSIIGAPYLIFKGLIKSTDIVDSPKNIKVKWALTSHWGDFVQVNGRLTNDAVHRALDNDGRPQPEVAKKQAYANDLGFAHAEDTINVLASYKHSEQVENFHVKKKWFKTKITKYMETVVTDREVDLNFSLSSKYIPVVYGIDKVQGRPIFVDTKQGDADNIYIAHMLCEGEIGGIYDIYIDGQPSVCFNKEDYDDRNLTNGASKDDASIVCRGRADKGQTIGGTIISGDGISGSSVSDLDEIGNQFEFSGDGIRRGNDHLNLRGTKYHTENRSLVATTTVADGEGVSHRGTFKFTRPNEIHGTFYAGKEDQLASDLLVTIANSPGFKRQNDYYDDGSETYWSPNHQLLDTAYSVINVKIDEDATTIPEIEYVVKGKLINCYNYDYSYEHTPNNLYSSSGEDAADFSVGDSVTLKNTSGDAVLNADVFIIDKWSMRGVDGTEEYRFRYSDAPDLNYTDGIPAIKSFYMVKGSDTWHMNTSDHEFDSGTITVQLSTTTTATTAPSNGPCTWTVPSVSAGTDIWINNEMKHQSIDDSIGIGWRSDGIWNEYYDFTVHTHVPVTTTQPGGAGTSHVLTAPVNTTCVGGSTEQEQTIISKHQIKLPDTAASSDDAYNGLEIELTAVDETGNITRQIRTIEDYDGGDRLASVTPNWDGGNAPKERDGVTYTYKIFFPNGDRRVSINTAIQLMDYMTSKTYGKGLDSDDDLSKSDWLQAARVCDTRGTQTLNISSGSATAGDRFVLTTDGTTSGTINTIGRVQSTISSATSIIMEECFGNFTKEFMKNSHSYSVGDILHTSEGYFRCTSAGYKSAKPTAASHTGWSAVMTSFPIHKLGQSGSTNTKTTTITSTTLSVVKTATDDADATLYQNPVTFSIYDMSFVKYWRYLGWEQHHQRWVTRHQTCGTVDTSASVLDTVGGFLEQMNGMMTYEAGKYCLKIATTTDSIVSAPVTAANSANGETYQGYTPGSEANVRYITNDDIIGNISLKDAGVSKAYNTVTSQIEMPRTQWKGKSVSFYDSNYLKADKMVVKSGSLSQPSVINYFNARINVENYLRKSRFGMTVNFTIGPKALLLKAGTTIKITHDKFGWTGKTFRIININYKVDCNAVITATEYDDSFYTISPPRLPSVLNEDFRAPVEAPPGTPTSLAATAGAVGSINLTWAAASGITANSKTEIWVNSSNSAYGAILATVEGTAVSFQHNVGADGATRYYWIRHKKTIHRHSRNRVLYGPYTAAVNATTVIPSSLYDVVLQADALTFQANSSGTISAPNNITFTAQRHNLSAAVAFTTSPSVTLTGSGDSRVLSKGNMGSNTTVTITGTVTSTTAERTAGADNTYTSNVTITRTDAGAAGSTGSDGAAGAAGPKTATGQLFYQSEAASAPSAPSNSSVAFNFTTGAMSGGVIGTGSTNWNITPPTATAGATTSKIWYVYYSVTESSAGSGTGQPTLGSTVLQGTGFTNAVTFSSGDFSQNGSAITTIDGGNIGTGTVAAARIHADLLRVDADTDLTGGSISGITIDTNKMFIGTGTINNANTAFYVDSNGSMSLKDKLYWNGTTLIIDGSITMSNQGSINISGFNNNSGFTDDTAADAAQSTANTGVSNAATAQSTANSKTTASAAASAANSQDKTGGSVGGWSLSSTSIESAGSSPKITIANEAHSNGPYILISD